MEKRALHSLSLLTLIVLSLSLTLAQTYSIDISGIKSEEYNLGEEVNFKVVLLEGENLINKEVTVMITDALKKKEITKTVNSNTETNFKIEKDFVGGIWTIKANFEDASVERTFLVGENTEVEFEISGDELIIKNTGNVRYTKTIQIKIGTETKSYYQNIGVGEEKRLKLISPKGSYDIEVTDGKNTIKRENVQLFGTGNVIGAVDEELVGYTGFAGTADPSSEEGKAVQLTKLPVTLAFITAVVVLAVVVIAGRRMTKRR